MSKSLLKFLVLLWGVCLAQSVAMACKADPETQHKMDLTFSLILIAYVGLTCFIMPFVLAKLANQGTKVRTILIYFVQWGALIILMMAAFALLELFSFTYSNFQYYFTLSLLSFVLIGFPCFKVFRAVLAYRNNKKLAPASEAA